MSDSHQSGCFSFKSLLGRRTSSARSAELTVAALSHTVRSSDEKSGLRDSTTPAFASCCNFAHPASAGNLWRPEVHADAPPVYRADGKDDVYRPEVMKTIEEAIDALDPELRELSLKIHSHPEIMFKETYAHDTLTEFMAAHGFKITKHYKDMPTAWRAVYTHKSSSKTTRTSRTLGVNSEMDALPNIGHACGHNLIAAGGVAVALAVTAALRAHDLLGTVVLLGTPAEEGGQGKATLITRGAYKEMDACVMLHPGPGPKNTAALGPSLALQGIEVEFFGHTAHASAAPWEGTNALDAAFIAYSSISVLRQQIKPDHRVHGVIKGPQDLAANVIPDYTKMLWYVRAPSYAEVEVLRARVLACFEAAAKATGCKYKTSVDQPAMDLRQNSVLGHEFADVCKARYGMDTTLSEGAIGGSTDFGNVTYELPAIHPAYSIPTVPNGGNHTPEFTGAAKTPAAHAATLRVAKALAHTGFRVLDDDAFYGKAKKAYEEGWTFEK